MIVTQNKVQETHSNYLVVPELLLVILDMRINMDYVFLIKHYQFFLHTYFFINNGNFVISKI